MDRIINNSVRYSGVRTSRRDRQCYECMGVIRKGEKYQSHQFRYDKTILTVSFHDACFNNLLFSVKEILIFGGYAYLDKDTAWPFVANETIKIRGTEKGNGLYITVLDGADDRIILRPIKEGRDIRLVKGIMNITAFVIPL